MPHPIRLTLSLALPLLLAACGGSPIVPGQQAADCVGEHLGLELSPAPVVQLTRSDFRERFGGGDASSSDIDGSDIDGSDLSSIERRADAICHDGTVYYFGRMDAELAAHEQAHCAERADGIALGLPEQEARAVERFCKSPNLPQGPRLTVNGV